MSASDRLVILPGKQWAFYFRTQLFKARYLAVQHIFDAKFNGLCKMYTWHRISRVYVNNPKNIDIKITSLTYLEFHLNNNETKN